MKKFFLFTIVLFSVMCAASCRSEEVTLDEQYLIGTWTETYEDYPNYMSEGSIEYTFTPAHIVQIHVYDVFAGDTTYTKHYDLGLFGDNSLCFNAVMSDYSGEGYIITKHTKNEMEWQRMGTEFMPGTVGGDFRHLRRKNK